MSKFSRNRIFYVLGLLSTLALFFQNCSQPFKVAPTDPSQYDSQGRRLYTGQVTVGASKANPPLDLIFVVDNSASMLGHQIDLGAAFATMFQSNISSLSGFDTRLFIYSTASTVNNSFVTQVPSRSPSSITSVPLATDTASLATIPGGIFGIWNSATGTFGTAPFNEQFYPASVLDMDPTQGAVTPFIMNAQKGGMSDTAYQAQINSLTQQFQSRVAFLNPTNQLNYGTTTDVSSGLCSISRVLRHPDNVIRAGDSAAFVIVSDDNDRLNVRNTNNNQCMESIVGSSTVVDGTCGHYETDYNYNTVSSITYQYDTKLNYESGTKIAFSYPSSENCSYNYHDGYSYTSTYTAVQTLVTYTKCNTVADGTCVSTTPGATITLSGNYVGSGNSCNQDMSALVPSPISGSPYTCASANAANQAGASGVDANSNGSSCSASTLSSLTSNPNHINVACAIGSLHTTSNSANNQTIGSCSTFCANHSSLSGCSLTGTTTNTSNSSLSVTQNGLTCSSACPNSGVCGTGTIGQYITSTYGGNATCGSASAVLSTLTVNSAVNSDETQFGCASSLSGFTVKNSSGSAVCAGQANVASCISSLQTGTNTVNPTCSVAGYDTTRANAAVNVGCATTCSGASGFCSNTLSGSSTVKDDIAKMFNGYCVSNSNGSAAKVTLKFKSSIGAGASCASLCSDTLSGSCDGNGYGATDGSTVATYVQSLGGANCTPSTRSVSDTASFAVDPANTGSACTLPASPFFFASDSPHVASPTVNYVAGDVNHRASDFQSYIASQSNLVLGANNSPAMAVITQLPGDNLPGTDVGQDYINLANSMGSNQISSIKSDYSVALSQISAFIVKSTQNSYALPIAPTEVVVSVSVLKSGSSVSQLLDPSLWTWAGQTLSLGAGANLQIGDQIIYQYRN